MHYYIDGYNLLFRLMHTNDNLQNLREEIILDLNKKVVLLKLDASIVFDATFQIGGDRTRSHFNALEILFTAEGETADEFILDELKNSSKPHQETVITSDKTLARHSRHYLAHTESVEAFITRLNKSYKNKVKQPKKPAIISRKASPFFEPNPPQPQLLPQPKVEENADDYARIFEKRYQELIKHEKPRKEKPVKLLSKKERRAKDPFREECPSPEPSTEIERWLKTFENRLHNPDPHAKY